MVITRQQLKFRVRSAFRLTDQDGYRLLTPQHLDHLLNQAQIDVRMDLKDRYERWRSNFTASQRAHTLPDDFLEVHEIWVAPSGTFQGYRMKGVPYSELVPEEVRFSTEVRTVSQVNGAREYRYTIAPEKILYIDPVFSSATAFDLFYYPSPIQMDEDTDAPDIEEPFMDAVLVRAKFLVAQDIVPERYTEFYNQWQLTRNEKAPVALARQNRMSIMRNGY